MLLLPLLFSQTHVMPALRLAATVALVVIGVYALTLLLGFYPVGSVGVFFEKWRFASPTFEFLSYFFNGKQVFLTLLLIALISCTLSAYICCKNRQVIQSKPMLLVAVMQLMLALPLLLSPVVFPWYLMPLLPLLALYPNKYLIIWTLLMPMTYELIGGFACCQIWQPAAWPVWLLGLLQLTALLALLRYCYQNWGQLTKPPKPNVYRPPANRN